MRAFTFDASACTGCKTCQVACKDKNGLPVGLLWRRVYEVSGGSWERRGAAWTNTVFAYNVSVACNHCAEPACAAACPTGACSVRDDGIVWIDSARCAGCEYCAWVCPYSAPAYSHDLGRMTKCDFCLDLVDQGLSPACVAACPMRALDFTDVVRGPTAERTDMRALWDAPPTTHPYPLPAFSRTQPRIAIQPHVAMQNALTKNVANREEVRPPRAAAGRTVRTLDVEDLPLVLFTLLGQAAAGLAVVSLFVGSLPVPARVATGVLTALAALASLFHLGTPSRAGRMRANARSSALSREVVMLCLFAAAWILAWFDPPTGRVVLALCGFALVYAMADVYAIDGIPGWDRGRARAAFASTALLLGSIVLLAVSRPGGFWPIILIAGGVFADQFARRRRFYDARRRAKVM